LMSFRNAGFILSVRLILVGKAPRNLTP